MRAARVFLIMVVPVSLETSLALRPTFRFAPTPNGRLHLGHAYSALCNERAARAVGGALRLRIEDTDPTRAKREFEQAIVEDMRWLGVDFDGPIRRQSDHLDDYAAIFERLRGQDLVYPCFCTRGRILAASGGARDPDGGPLHVGRCFEADGPARLARGEAAGWRLDLQSAMRLISEPLGWEEFGEGTHARRIAATPLAWGDVLLRGRERAATYHLAVVVDDAIQRVTDVVRGRDLLPSTSVHVLLQALVGLAAPRYRHHRLALDRENAKMSKSAASQPLRALRDEGYTARDIRAALGFGGVPSKPLAVALS